MSKKKKKEKDLIFKPETQEIKRRSQELPEEADN